jgi:1,2-diacylglycerol 3-beta-galactosyltransferase
MSDTGGGHRSAARAIAEGLRRTAGDNCQVDLHDFLAASLFPFNLSAPLYAIMVHYPFLLKALWYPTNSRRFFQKVAGLFELFLRRGIEPPLRESHPGVVVAVHPTANHAAARILKRMGAAIPLVTVVTDLVRFHVSWACTDVDRCVVPTEEARSLVIRYGMAPEKVNILGLPIHPRFAEVREDKAALRRELGLDPTLFTVLVVGGGEGAGRIDQQVEAVAQANLKAQLVVVAGRNVLLKRKLEGRDFVLPVKVYGFVENMPELMHAADLLLTKAGPATISEALTCGLPMILTSAFPGQEEDNVRYVGENSVGRFARTPEELAAVLRELSSPDNPALAMMAENARRLARPNAALNIARLILDQAQRGGIER